MSDYVAQSQLCVEFKNIQITKSIVEDFSKNYILDDYDVELQFLLYLAKKYSKEYVIPHIIRLYQKKLLPKLNTLELNN
jgi:hypothetical protein